VIPRFAIPCLYSGRYKASDTAYVTHGVSLASLVQCIRSTRVRSPVTHNVDGRLRVYVCLPRSWRAIQRHALETRALHIESTTFDVAAHVAYGVCTQYIKGSTLLFVL
jgi:hypothetical protein